IVWTACIAAILGIGQYAGILNWLFPHYPGSSPIYSVFANPGLLGGFVAIATPLILTHYLKSERLELQSHLVMAILLSALLMSGARTAWLACAAGCFIAIWSYRARVRRLAPVFVTFVLAALVCIVLAPGPIRDRIATTFTSSDAGMNLRWWFWAGTWKM